MLSNPKALVFALAFVITAVWTIFYLYEIPLPLTSTRFSLPQIEPPIVEQYDLQTLCSKTAWTEGLWIHCHSFGGPQEESILGGLNNARNRIQTCLRLAIDSGAGLILGTVTTRDEANLVNTNHKPVCPDFFWDIEGLERELQNECPQLQLRSCGNTTGITRKLKAPRRVYTEASHTKDTFRQLTQKVLVENKIRKKKITPLNPVIIEYGDSYLAWNYTAAHERATISKQLFKTLTYNRDILNLAKQVSSALETLAPFVAIHFRSESDWPAVFGSASQQMAVYTAELEQLRNTSSIPVKTVYISSGDSAAIQRFREHLTPLGFAVHDKFTLLSQQPDVAAEIEQLPFDQKAIVEYEALVSADYFFGILTSSLSALVAYARTAGEEEDYFATYVHPGTSRGGGIERHFPGSPCMRGNLRTRLFVLDGPDIMDCYP